MLAVAAAIFSFPSYYNKKINFAVSKIGIRGLSLNIREAPFKFGLDLRGGVHLLYDADLSNIPGSEQADAMAGLRDVIERRINLFGVSEPVVQIIKNGKNYRLAVDIAGTINPAKAIKLIGKTPFLEFKEQRPPAETQKILDKRKELKKIPSKEWPKVKNWQLAIQDPYFQPTKLTGRYLKKAQISFDQTTQEPLVLINFNKEGAKIFENLTAKNIGKKLAIYIDNALISAPVVQNKIVGGEAQISGSFTVKEAKDLARNLSAGALPVPVRLVSQEQIGPILGQISLAKSLKAGIAGFLVIVIFMVLFYKLPGLLSSIALVFYAIFTFAVFKLVGVTLTLAGIGGFILSIGMAIDANILILSRFREEVKERKNIAASQPPAFSRAWPSIRDGNLTTLAVALILFLFGSGFIKGFSFTLGLGILVSIFSAMVVTKLLMTMVAPTRLGRVFWLWT